MIAQLLSVVLLLCSFYFSFVPHETQCIMLKNIIPNCFLQWVHLLIGVVFFVLAVALYNYEYIFDLFSHKG